MTELLRWLPLILVIVTSITTILDLLVVTPLIAVLTDHE